MIKNVWIKNFKCYGSRGANFKLSQLNFIFGDNSAGKSTLLQFLKLVDAVYTSRALHEIRCSNIDCRHLSCCPQIEGEELQHMPDDVAVAYRQFNKEKGNAERRIWGRLEEDDIGFIFGPLASLKGEDHYCLRQGDNWEVVRAGENDTGVVLHMQAERVVERHFFPLSLLDSIKELPPAEADRRRKEDKEYADRIVPYVNNFLSRIGVEYECERVHEGCPFTGLRIRDKIYGIELELDDVGTGIRGLYRIAQRFATWKGETILEIEEPDTHVNERQIAPLTQVMVEEALKHSEGQLIVECHSKIMALQLAALVRDGVLKMDGEDANLSMMEVSKTPYGSIVEPIHISRRGDIDWPNGFFPAEGELLRKMYEV